MILNLENEVDKKFSQSFTKEIIDNIKPGIIGNLGMNITFDDSSDITFKMYYEPKYSEQLYKKYNKNIPVINFLKEINMLDVFEVVHDKGNNECRRFNVKLKSCSNSNITQLFDWLEQNVKFTKKYRDEILSLARIGNPSSSEYRYASLFFIGFICNEEQDIQSFKCYFLNEKEQDDYYLNFIKNSKIRELKELLPIVEKILPKNERKLWMEGIDYNENCSEKHKIYINFTQEMFDNIKNVVPNGSLIENKINLIKEWHNLHSEFFCDGFAIGKDTNNKLTLNIYFRFKKLK